MAAQPRALRVSLRLEAGGEVLRGPHVVKFSSLAPPEAVKSLIGNMVGLRDGSTWVLLNAKHDAVPIFSDMPEACPGEDNDVTALGDLTVLPTGDTLREIKQTIGEELPEWIAGWRSLRQGTRKMYARFAATTRNGRDANCYGCYMRARKRGYDKGTSQFGADGAVFRAVQLGASYLIEDDTHGNLTWKDERHNILALLRRHAEQHPSSDEARRLRNAPARRRRKAPADADRSAANGATENADVDAGVGASRPAKRTSVRADNGSAPGGATSGLVQETRARAAVVDVPAHAQQHSVASSERMGPGGVPLPVPGQFGTLPHRPGVEGTGAVGVSVPHAVAGGSSHSAPPSTHTEASGAVTSVQQS